MLPKRKRLKGKSLDTPNRLWVEPIAEGIATRRKEHEPRVEVAVLRRTPVVRGRELAKVAGDCSIGA